MTAKRRCPSATPGARQNPSPSGPRGARADVMFAIHVGSRLAQVGSIRPAMPHMPDKSSAGARQWALDDREPLHAPGVLRLEAPMLGRLLRATVVVAVVAPVPARAANNDPAARGLDLFLHAPK